MLVGCVYFSIPGSQSPCSRNTPQRPPQITTLLQITDVSATSDLVE